MRVNLISFGFKHGVPGNVSLVLDVRGIRNPHGDRALRHLTGLDEKVRRRVMGHQFSPFLISHGLLLVEHRDRAGYARMTLGIGCTGGNHRSVAIAEHLARLLRPHHLVDVKHRDMRSVQAAAPD